LILLLSSKCTSIIKLVKARWYVDEMYFLDPLFNYGYCRRYLAAEGM